MTTSEDVTLLARDLLYERDAYLCSAISIILLHSLPFICGSQNSISGMRSRHDLEWECE
jgi:hypothetical protein